MTANSHQFETLFNHATIDIVVTNKEGKIINFNKYAETVRIFPGRYYW